MNSPPKTNAADLASARRRGRTGKRKQAEHTTLPFIVECSKSGGRWIVFSRHADVREAERTVALLH
ncbi:MAG: hypothetical protein ACRD3W_11925, partial [Terriglobales bacterium]